MLNKKPANSPKDSMHLFEGIGLFLEKIGTALELLFIIFIWYLIFSNSNILGGFMLEDMIAYLLVGNMIGLFTSYLLSKTVKFNIGQGDLKMFYYKPLSYMIRVFLRTIKRLFLPFLLSIIFNTVLLYFFVSNNYLNTDFRYLFLIFLMMILAFFTELLLAFIIDMYVFWSFESRNLSKMVARLKKIFAGAYFPLSFLGAGFLFFSLLFPFAYSFYVPTQLYLKNMTFGQGLMGVTVQVFWIVLLYFVIKISWKKKIQDTKNEQTRKSILK